MSLTDDEAATTATPLERLNFRVTEIAERNAVSPTFVRQEIAAGRLRARRARPGVKGSRILVSAEAEREWLESLESA